MTLTEIREILDLAHRGQHAVCIRAVNRSGNTIDLVGFVMAIGGDGVVRLREGDPVAGLAHEFSERAVLRAQRVHGA